MELLTRLDLQKLSSLLKKKRWQTHAIHQSFLSYKATPWTFWPHVIFKVGIPLFFASSGSQVKAVSPAVWTILEVSDSEYSVRIILTIDSLQSSFLTHDILCPQNIWTSDCLQFSFDTDIMCSVKSFPRVESAL